MDGSEIIVEEKSGFHVVRPGERLGVHETESLREILEGIASEKSAMVMLDMRDVMFLGSRAIGVIMAARGEIERGRGRIILGEVNPEVLRVLQMTRVDTLFEIVNNVDSVLERSEKLLGDKQQ